MVCQSNDKTGVQGKYIFLVGCIYRRPKISVYRTIQTVMFHCIVVGNIVMVDTRMDGVTACATLKGAGTTEATVTYLTKFL